MTEPTPTAPVRRTVTLGDKDILVESLDELQYLFLSREATLLQSDKITVAEKVRRAGRLFNTLESAIVSEEDREYVRDLISEKKMNIQELLKIVRSEEEGAPAPKVRRAPVRRTRK